MSPEAELSVITKELATTVDPGVSTHVSKRVARRIVARAVRAVLETEGLSEVSIRGLSQSTKFFLNDLDTGTTTL